MGLSDEGQKYLKSSGIAGFLAKIGAGIVGLAGLLTALDAIADHVPVACRVWPGFFWCTNSVTSGNLGPGAPPLAYIENPVLAPMQQTMTTGDGSAIGVHEIGLYGCANNGSNIDCYLTETSMGSWLRNYRIDDLFGPETKLVDNLHQVHSKIRAAWIDGKRNQQEDLHQGQNDPAWFLLEFDGADPEISTVRIEFRAFKGGYIEGKILKT